ncbi:MAG TPA: 50S ribosomal protein L13 [Candidatus Woesebacteria bacterium]|jgi:large subunit ribosomal protein L13|nr:50S ribosomal protein L13 [Candidatus Woesebacteria bacterium]
MKTSVLKGNQVNRNWHLIDLSNQTLGRICTQIASILMGKDKTTFSYHRDDGDYVVAINAADIRVTGSKLKDKIYRRHTHWPGGLKELTLNEMLKKDPRLVIKSGVYGMLPKNKLRDRRMTRLKIFTDSNHPYADKLTK